MADLATYNFAAQADANPLPNPPWATPAGFSDLRIVSGRAQVTVADTDCWGLHSAGGVAWPSEQYAATILGTVGGGDCGPVVHGTPGGQNGYMCTNFGGTDLRVFEIVAGTFTEVAIATGSYSASEIYLESKNAGANKVVKAFLAGVDTVTYTDTSPRANGTPGLFHFDGTSRAQSWRGGDFNAAVTRSAPPGLLRNRAARLAALLNF